MRLHPSSFGPVLLAAGLLACGPALAATEIGVTSAVVPAARGKPVDAEARVLQVGLDMQANERVQTDAGGKAHLLFLDGSALSIGPNSDVVLDEYVYDPASRTGKIALSATRGVFRLVGGAISKTTPVTLTTPTATIGVRGGIAMITAGAQGVEAGFVYGKELFVEGGGKTQRVERPGFSIATGPDGTPQPPQPLTQQSVDRQNAAFEGGGAPPPGAPPVSDEDVAQTQVAVLNSVAEIGNMAPAAGGGGGPLPVPPPPDETTEPSQNQATDAAAVNACAAGSTDPACTEDDRVPDDIAGAGGDGQSGGGNDQGGEVETPPAPQPPLTLSPLFSGRAKHASVPALGTDDETNNFPFAGGTIANGVFDAPVHLGRFTAPVQDGSFPVTAAEQPFGPGLLTGTGFLAPDRDFVLYELTDTGDGHKVIVFAGAPTPPEAFPTDGATFYRFRRDFVLDSDIPFVNRASGGDVLDGLPESSEPNAAIYWDVSQSPSAQAAFLGGTVAFRGQGSAQKSAVSVFVGEINFHQGELPPSIESLMRGTSRVAPDQFAHFFSSSANTVDDDLGNDFFGAAGPNYFALDANANDGVTDFTPDVEVPTIFNPNAVALMATAALDPRASRTLNGYSAGVSRLFRGPPGDLSVDSSTVWNDGNPLDVEIITNAATNKLRAIIEVEELSDFSPTIRVGFGDDVVEDATSGRSAFIDNSVFGAIEASPDQFTPSLDGGSSTALLYLLAPPRIEGDGFLPAGVQLCQCQYAVWGFWGGQVALSDGDDTVLAHLIPWAAGPIADIAAIQGLSGTATYAGHVVGQVLNASGQVYHAFGGLTLTADFGLQTITGGSISNYDGGSYNISGGPTFSSISSLNVFHASLTGASGTAVGRSGSIDGSFVQGGADPAAEVIGHFEASGTGYDTAGVLIGRKTGP